MHRTSAEHSTRPLLFFFNQHSIRLDCSLLLAPSSSSSHQCVKLKNRQTGGRPLSDSLNSSVYDSRPQPTITVAILILYHLSSIFYHIYAVNVDSLSLIRVPGLLFLSLAGFVNPPLPMLDESIRRSSTEFRAASLFSWTNSRTINGYIHPSVHIRNPKPQTKTSDHPTKTTIRVFAQGTAAGSRAQHPGLCRRCV